MFELFEKIPLRFRFLGIGLLFTLVFLSHIVFDLTQSLIQEKRGLQLRLSGLDYITTSNAQLETFQKIRGLNNLYLEGEHSVRDEIAAAESDAKHNFALLSNLEHPNDTQSCNERLDDIRHGFETLEKRSAQYRSVGASEKEKADLFDAYSSLIDRLLSFNSYVAVTYNVGENADWHLFVLSELFSERIPASIEILGRLRGIAAGSIQHGIMTSYEKEQLEFYVQLLKHNRSIIEAKLQHIFEHNNQLQKGIRPHMQPAVEANRELLGSIELYLKDPKSVRVDGKTFFSMATKNMSNASHFLDSIHNSIERQIRDRAQERINALWLKIYFESLALLSGLVVFWFFYLSSMGYIRKVEKAEKAKAAFLSHMSHEIRTPLNAILGFIGILKGRTTESESLKFIETIQKSSTHLLNIINDILDLSKIESGKLSIELVAFHPRPELNPIISIYMAKAGEKKISFNLLIDSEVPKCITSDPVRIKQIVSNLLSNAIKFTPEEGSVTLHIGYDDEDRILTIDVSDTGIGIPHSKHKKVFDAFIQAEESTTRHYGGTGLGLAICSKLVSMMGGEIELVSEEGRGSRFSVSIPIPHCVTCVIEYDEETLLRHKNATHVATPKPRRFTGNVLLVEDNETNQMYMEIILEKLGLNYEIAQDGVEAVEKFQRAHYDIILMDENMPRMNGLEAAKIILQIERDENRPHTPTIAVTANALQGDKEIFLEAGMDGYLSKPVEQEALYGIFEKYLKKENLINYPIKSFIPKT